MIADSQNATELIQSYIGGKRNFRNANLSGLELKRAHLPEIDLQGAYLRWVDFQGANLQLANLPWADLQKANLSDATLQQAMLKEANLRKANLQWADLQQAQLQGANLVNSNLICTNFRGASLRLAKLEAADLDKAKLTGADLRIANLKSAQLRNADLKNGKLQGANLQYANLTGANLEGVNLQGADLTGAKLYGANLQNANLQQANLEAADLTEAQLCGANLQGANLEKTILPSLQNMQGACFKQAQFIDSILPKGQILDNSILENGLISYRTKDRTKDRTNVTKSLSPITETEVSELMHFASDDEEPKNAAISEGQTDGLLDRPVDSFIDEELSSIDPPLGLNPQEISLEPKLIFPASDVDISDPIDLNLPSSYVDRDRDSIENHQADRSYGYRIQKVNPEPEELLTIIQQRMGAEGHFTSTSLAIAKRRGPYKFRQKLLVAYNRRCSMTGCEIEPILEVAFLQPNLPDRNSDPSNALLLRADIHTLFDLNLIAIDPETMKIILAPSLRNGTYSSLDGQPLRSPNLEAFKPNLDDLKLRLQWCSWLNVAT